MTSILKRWAGAAMVMTGLTVAAGAAHGQDLQGDVWQYQRDRQQAARDYNQLNRDIATGNAWGVMRDVNNIQQDRRDLCQDQQNIRTDAQYLTSPYPTTYGGYPAPSCRPSYGGYPSATYPQATPYVQPVTPYGQPVAPYGQQQVAPYGVSTYGGGYAPVSGYRPW